MMAWDRLCYPKGMGGIGFRNMHLFNIALLGRQVWRLLKFKDTSCFKVLSAKYFPEGDVLRPKYCDKPSFTWSSIVKASEALKDGFLWQIGDGNTIDIRRDQWGIEGFNGDSVCRSPLTAEERKVKDLWDHNQGRWKKDRVIELYGKTMGDYIYNLPILHNGINDSLTWTQNPHGCYSSKSAYSWLSLRRIGFGPHRMVWRVIWKLKMIPKIKVFSWKICHNILPTYDNIARIRPDFSTACPRCNSGEETLIHAMQKYPKVREILMIGGLNNRLIEGRYERCVDWVEDVLQELDKKAAADFFTLLWNCWNAKNKLVFQGKDDTTKVVWERAQTLSKEFRIFNLADPPALPPTPVRKSWTKPPKGVIKINVDPTVLNGKVGYGAIARDHDGFVIGGCYVYANKNLDVTWAESEAFVEGLNLALKLEVDQLILESDCASLVNAVNKRDNDVTILGCYLNKACMNFKNFTSVHINWIDCCRNRVADLLCNLAIKEKCNLFFNVDYPKEIHNIVIDDVMN
ncbi:hypothetical protein PVK06_012029 [Gossypium arboreum]|uniref:Reverse transcriptase n=1 Tax=Gossypium arboreum TaxID=29729 RepID=A0ABR0QAS7_GOSAR|nr:hypothetical protein PVK06_012029 [Gossypium arboreum]